jgi:DNA-binding transcriptional ArsR family regulator
LFKKENRDAPAICDALSVPTRAELLRELIRAYPERLSIGQLKKRLGLNLADMTVHFHLRRLSECGLVELDGSRRGFRALNRALSIRFNGDGFHIEKEEAE